VRLNPKDQLSAQLLAGLTNENKPETAETPEKPETAETPEKRETPAAPAPGVEESAAPAAAESKPATVADLQGDWTATRSDNAAVSLSIKDDGTYSWKYTQAGKSQEFSGAFTVAENLLILKQNGAPAMIGQVALIDGHHFNFKLMGTGANDPGITFSKK
jgi:hypothetical protein